MKRRDVLGAFGATAVMTFAGSRARAEQLLPFYDLPAKYMNWAALGTAYEKRTGVKLTIDLKTGSSTALAAMKAEVARPQVNGAFWSLDIAIEGKKAGVTMPYKPKGFDAIPDSRKDRDGHWWAMSSANIVIGANTDVLRKHNLPLPKTWNDLLKPDYKGLCGMMEPTYSGTASTFAYGINFIQGGTKDDFTPGMKWLKAFADNGGQYRSETMGPRLVTGDVGILIDAEGNILLPKAEGAPVVVIAPPDGVVAVELGMSMMKGAPDQERARQFFDWLLGDEAQSIIGASYFRPVRKETLPKAVAAELGEPEKLIPLDLEHEAAVVTNLKRAFTEIVTRGGDLADVLRRYRLAA
ncbi:putative spermidine/putrescine transport system substrate-binding protein [Enhydrobacter aerosaccus]|uniref:Putative spermidine/putrescine transport system substrate-binding protein n=1 Tax=Enhydrobacter aerosaccus TaxID=225324 RepID=A0A1T4PD34_9HYPH|nr:extracellular solute-binding protein [Enhydrobacter aerosaccus]SJZ89470.1 putative spermidine/putrescine transport system substrate-binding protein [Enhydrobacter aerosaccus]